MAGIIDISCNGALAKQVSIPKANIHYTRILDVERNKQFNVFGVVSQLKRPFRTRTCEFCIVIMLVDESVPYPAFGLKCNIFSKRENLLPAIKGIGDIIRLHNLFISTFKGELQGKGNCSGDLEWMVFPRGYTPVSIRTSPVYSCYCEADLKRANELQKVNLVSGEESLQMSHSTRFLSDIEPDMYLNMVVQVVGVYTFPTNRTCMMLRVWDGTVPKLESFHPIAEHLSTAQRCSFDEIEVDDRLVARVYVFDDHVPGILSLEAGRIIELRNLHVSAVKPSLMEKLKFAGNTYDRTISHYMQLIVHKGTAYNRGIVRMRPDSKQCLELHERIARSRASSTKSIPSVVNKISSSRKRTRPSESATDDDETELPVSRRAKASTGSNLFLQSNRQPEEEPMEVDSACVIAGPSNAFDTSSGRPEDNDEDCNSADAQEALAPYRSATCEDVVSLIKIFCDDS